MRDRTGSPWMLLRLRVSFMVSGNKAMALCSLHILRGIHEGDIIQFTYIYIQIKMLHASGDVWNSELQ